MSGLLDWRSFTKTCLTYSQPSTFKYWPSSNSLQARTDSPYWKGYESWNSCIAKIQAWPWLSWFWLQSVNLQKDEIVARYNYQLRFKIISLILILTAVFCISQELLCFCGVAYSLRLRVRWPSGFFCSASNCSVYDCSSHFIKVSLGRGLERSALYYSKLGPPNAR